MPTAVEQIHTKIAQLEARIGDLRITERELQALDRISARQTKAAAVPKAKQRAKQKSAPRPRAASGRRQPGQTMGAAITEVLGQHGPIQAAEIAERIKATGRDINNRAISFALQALKKRGLAKNTGGKWTTANGRGRKARSVPGASVAQIAA
jgi:Ribonuclease R winged-helix domain